MTTRTRQWKWLNLPSNLKVTILGNVPNSLNTNRAKLSFAKSLIKLWCISLGLHGDWKWILEIEATNQYSYRQWACLTQLRRPLKWLVEPVANDWLFAKGRSFVSEK